MRKRLGACAEKAARHVGIALHSRVARLSTGRKRAVLLLCDLLLLHLSFALALILVRERLPRVDNLATHLQAVWLDALLMSAVAAALLWQLGLTRIKLKAFDWKAIAGTALFAAAMGLAGMLIGQLTGRVLPLAASVVGALLLFALVVLGRVAMLQVLLWVYRQPHQQHRVLIYGAGTTGLQLSAALATHDSIKAVAFIDDNRALRGQRVGGLPVHGPEELPRLVAAHGVERVLLAMPGLPRDKLSLKLLHLQALGVAVHAVPSFAALAGDGRILAQMRPLSMDDLLGRDDLTACLPDVEASFSGRSVLISGAGGSIGSELCRQLLICRPARLVLLERSEPALYQIRRELAELCRTKGVQGIELVARLGSVHDAGLMRRLMVEHGVEVVLHAAAYKHVPLVEENPLAGLANNVLGTRVLAECAREAGVADFLLVSTDKAVRPRSMMGASKRLAELVVQDLATRPGSTRFSMVRFGNVLGSSGSVFPLFREQIAKGGPVTLTHEEVTRYFMSIPEAARLVLIAVGYARGGDVFVLDMGDPVPIRRLAEQMIEAAGLTVRNAANPRGDIEIRVTGLRPGEKLHEELLTGADRVTTPHPKILRCDEPHLSEIEVATMLRELGQAVAAGDAEAGRRAVLRWVGENDIDPPSVGVPAALPAAAAEPPARPDPAALARRARSATDALLRTEDWGPAARAALAEAPSAASISGPAESTADITPANAAGPTAPRPAVHLPHALTIPAPANPAIPPCEASGDSAAAQPQAVRHPAPAG